MTSDSVDRAKVHLEYRDWSEYEDDIRSLIKEIEKKNADIKILCEAGDRAYENLAKAENKLHNAKKALIKEKIRNLGDGRNRVDTPQERAIYILKQEYSDIFEE